MIIICRWWNFVFFILVFTLVSGFQFFFSKDSFYKQKLKHFKGHVQKVKEAA